MHFYEVPSVVVAVFGRSRKSPCGTAAGFGIVFLDNSAVESIIDKFIAVCGSIDDWMVSGSDRAVFGVVNVKPPAAIGVQVASAIVRDPAKVADGGNYVCREG